MKKLLGVIVLGSMTTFCFAEAYATNPADSENDITFSDCHGKIFTLAEGRHPKDEAEFKCQVNGILETKVALPDGSQKAVVDLTVAERHAVESSEYASLNEDYKQLFALGFSNTITKRFDSGN